MIARMDRGIGRILDLVENLGLDEKTIFVFTSDNGPLYDQLGGTDAEFFNSHAGFRAARALTTRAGFASRAWCAGKDKLRPGSRATA